MAAGVRDMHKAGLIHRDVKAENFVFAESPAVAQAHGRPLTVTVIDLGMAMRYDPRDPVRGVRSCCWGFRKVPNPGPL